MTIAVSHILVGRTKRGRNSEVYNVQDNEAMDKDDIAFEESYADDDIMTMKERDTSSESETENR